MQTVHGMQKNMKWAIKSAENSVKKSSKSVRRCVATIIE